MQIEVITGAIPGAFRDGLLDLVVQQLHFIGYGHSLAEAELIIGRALSPGSPARLFVGTDGTGVVQAFAFGNRCCGLECGGDYLWLNELFVAPAYRRLGLGAEMLRFIRSWAKENGCVYMALVTHPRNTNAISFYESMGMETEPLIWVDTYL